MISIVVFHILETHCLKYMRLALAKKNYDLVDLF